MEKTYSISDLEQITGLSRRTIHYYTMEKLIPPPEGAGVSAKYHEVHLLRLILINGMQKSHIRLSGIREALEAMSIVDMRRLVDEINRSKASWDFDSIQNWLHGSSSAGSSSAPTPDSLQNDFMKSTVNEKNYSFLSRSEPDGNRSENLAGSNYLKQLKRKTVINDSSWRRLVITDGLEINIRSDVEQRHGQIIVSLIEQIKKLI